MARTTELTATPATQVAAHTTTDESLRRRLISALVDPTFEHAARAVGLADGDRDRITHTFAFATQYRQAFLRARWQRSKLLRRRIMEALCRSASDPQVSPYWRSRAAASLVHEDTEIALEELNQRLGELEQNLADRGEYQARLWTDWRPEEAARPVEGVAARTSASEVLGQRLIGAWVNPTLEHAAKAAGVSMEAARRITQTLAFATEYRRALTDARWEGRETYRGHVLDTLSSVLFDPRASVSCRLRAADSLLRHEFDLAVEQLHHRLCSVRQTVEERYSEGARLWYGWTPTEAEWSPARCENLPSSARDWPRLSRKGKLGNLKRRMDDLRYHDEACSIQVRLLTFTHEVRLDALATLTPDEKTEFFEARYRGGPLTAHEAALKEKVWTAYQAWVEGCPLLDPEFVRRVNRDELIIIPLPSCPGEFPLEQRIDGEITFGDLETARINMIRARKGAARFGPEAHKNPDMEEVA